MSAWASGALLSKIKDVKPEVASGVNRSAALLQRKAQNEQDKVVAHNATMQPNELVQQHHQEQQQEVEQQINTQFTDKAESGHEGYGEENNHHMDNQVYDTNNSGEVEENAAAFSGNEMNTNNNNNNNVENVDEYNMNNENNEDGEEDANEDEKVEFGEGNEMHENEGNAEGEVSERENYEIISKGVSLAPYIAMMSKRPGSTIIFTGREMNKQPFPSTSSNAGMMMRMAGPPQMPIVPPVMPMMGVPAPVMPMMNMPAPMPPFGMPGMMNSPFVPQQPQPQPQPQNMFVPPQTQTQPQPQSQPQAPFFNTPQPAGPTSITSPPSQPSFTSPGAHMMPHQPTPHMQPNLPSSSSYSPTPSNYTSNTGGMNAAVNRPTAMPSPNMMNMNNTNLVNRNNTMQGMTSNNNTNNFNQAMYNKNNNEMNNASSNVNNNYMPQQQQQMQMQPQPQQPQPQQQVNVNQFASPSQMANVNNMMHSTPPASMSQFGEIPRQFAMKQQQQQQQMPINSSGYANQFAQGNASVNTNLNNNPNTNSCNNNNNNTTAQYNEFSVQGATYNAPLNSMAAPYQPSHLQLRPPYVPSQH